MTVYSSDPLRLAQDFYARGARQLHVVDLEGAKDGQTPNFDLVAQIAKTTGLFVEVGGGVRSIEVASRYLDAGVSRVILGTAALTDPEFLKSAVEKFGDKIAVGVDALDGFVAIRGWTQKTQTPFLDFCLEMDALGVSCAIVTDISRDGMLGGANRAMYETLIGVCRMKLIASGGVSGVSDIAQLKGLNLYGAIVGKALYEQSVSLEALLEAAK